jgi:hypothetical protein
LRPGAGLLVATIWCLALPAAYAQQRPLVTEDAETIGAGRVLLEAGADIKRDLFFPVSGLVGHLLSVPTIGLSVGLSSIAELQLDGGLYRRLTITERRRAPLASAVNARGDTTMALDDLVVGMKIRFVSEDAGRPSIGVRFATKLPNVSNESGLGPDTTDVFASLLVAKTVQSVRVVGNGGVAILSDPTRGSRQDDLLTFGVSIARAVSAAGEVVGEINGRLNTAEGSATPGAESRAVIRLGGRYTRRAVRFDAAVLIGTRSPDPSFGVSAGLTWVFNAFQVP